MTCSGDTVALLGTPSVLRMASEQNYSRQFVLLDANPAVTDCLAKAAPKAKVLRRDVEKDPLPDLSAAAAIIDPPWYEEYIQSFLWTACQLCKIDGYLFVSVPPVGTRPNIEQEWANTLDWAQQIGLTFVRFEPAALPYICPPFEHNALKVDGLCSVPTEWRRSDLAIFLRSHMVRVPRPVAQHQKDEWAEENLYRSADKDTAEGVIRLRGSSELR